MFWRLRGKRVVDGLPTNGRVSVSDGRSSLSKEAGRDFPPELEQIVPNLYDQDRYSREGQLDTNPHLTTGGWFVSNA